ncbi:hypothetical protein OG948_56885 (plasmid) [Embleya sp. NBC_00888]|uniref:hypothetical protein n=1 Tax=Embleya sp. NBC_00888 TaxID=2975960 RepID=UPI002F91B4AB|nr:hypothetical protein OG948_56885 [Embleya sp. NBC_00888]
MWATAYNPAVAAATEIKQGNLSIKVAAIDDGPKIPAGISDGSVSATVAQNPAGRAHVGSAGAEPLVGPGMHRALPAP